MIADDAHGNRLTAHQPRNAMRQQAVADIYRYPLKKTLGWTGGQGVEQLLLVMCATRAQRNNAAQLLEDGFRYEITDSSYVEGEDAQRIGDPESILGIACHP